MADDLYAAAAQQANKGLSLDYYVNPETLQGEYKRPLDKHLNPLQKKLGLKMSLYEAPERPEDKAMLVVEQAREAKDATLRATLLERLAPDQTPRPEPSWTWKSIPRKNQKPTHPPPTDNTRATARPSPKAVPSTQIFQICKNLETAA